MKTGDRSQKTEVSPATGRAGLNGDVTSQNHRFRYEVWGGQLCPQPAFQPAWPPERRPRPTLAAPQLASRGISGLAGSHRSEE